MESWSGNPAAPIAEPLNSLHPPQSSATKQREPVPGWFHAGHPREGGSSGVKALGSISVVQGNKIFYDIFAILCNGSLRPQKKTLGRSKMQLSGANPAGTSLSLFLPSLPFSRCPRCRQEDLLPAPWASPASPALLSTSVPVLCACHILPQ